MKRILFLFISVLFFSCNFEIPKTVSIKTDAEYAFSLGNFSKDISEYLSAEKIIESMNSKDEESGNAAKYNIYDYNPNGTSDDVQQFLFELPIETITISPGESLNNTDFTKDISSEQSMSHTISVPNFADSSNGQEVEMPNLASKITDAYVGNILVAILENNEMFNIADKSEIEIKFTSPTFETVTVQEGSLVMDLGTPSGNYSDDFAASLTFTLYDSNGTSLGSTSGINPKTAPAANSFSVNVSGKTLTKILKIKITGSITGGDGVNFVRYTAKAHFSEGTKIAKVTGLTMAADAIGTGSTIDIDQTISLSSDPTFVSAKIKKGALTVVSKAPDEWTGIKATKTLSLSGGLTAADSDFDTSKETLYTTHFMNRSLDLANRTIINSDIAITGNITFSLENATLVFTDGKTPSVMVTPTCNIETLSEVTLDLAQNDTELSSEYKKTPAEIFKDANAIKSIKLAKASVNATYTNGLPEGNDISVTMLSNLFGIDDTKEMSAQTSDGTMEFTGTEEPVINPASTDEADALDFKISLSFPGATSDHPKYAVLKNIEPGKDYTVEFKVSPNIDWIEAQVDIESALGENGELEGSIDTSFNMDSIFSGMADIMGEDFKDHVAFSKMQTYFYCTKPELDVFSNMKFSGVMKMQAVTRPEDPSQDPTIDDEIYILGSKDDTNVETAAELAFSDFFDLDFKGSSKKTVITDVSAKPYSITADIAAFMNGIKESDLVVSYSLKASGTESGTITIKKEDLKNSSDSNSESTGSIAINARIVFPMMMDIINTEEEVAQGIYGYNMNLKKMISSNDDENAEDEDLFKRNEATDLSDIEKYMDIVESVTLDYSANNRVFVYSKKNASKNCKISIDLTALTKNEPPLIVKNTEYKMYTTSGTLTVQYEDFKNWLKYYPFSPDLNLFLPNGTISIPRKAEFSLDATVHVKTDGDKSITIFGD